MWLCFGGAFLCPLTTIAQAGRRAAAVAPQLTAEVNKLSGALEDAKSLPADCRPLALAFVLQNTDRPVQVRMT